MRTRGEESKDDMWNRFCAFTFISAVHLRAVFFEFLSPSGQILVCTSKRLIERRHVEWIFCFVSISLVHICALFRKQVVNPRWGQGGESHGIEFYAIIFISAEHVYAVIRKQIAKLG